QLDRGERGPTRARERTGTRHLGDVRRLAQLHRGLAGGLAECTGILPDVDRLRAERHPVEGRGLAVLTRHGHLAGQPLGLERTDGLIAVPSWASTMSTLAPCESRFSTLLACVSADDLASLEMYEPPPASMAALIAGSSHLAQRSSWKLFQETPTTHLPAPPP